MRWNRYDGIGPWKRMAPSWAEGSPGAEYMQPTLRYALWYIELPRLEGNRRNEQGRGHPSTGVRVRYLHGTFGACQAMRSNGDKPSNTWASGLNAFKSKTLASVAADRHFLR